VVSQSLTDGLIDKFDALAPMQESPVKTAARESMTGRRRPPRAVLIRRKSPADPASTPTNEQATSAV
jgi:hypothetical protein